MFQVGGIEAPIIDQLLRRPDLRLMSFAQAVAHARRSLYLRVSTVPREHRRPVADLLDRDIATVATMANLLAQNKLHPALMYSAARHGDRGQQQSCAPAEAGTFPNARWQEMPLANEAQRYYKSGEAVSEELPAVLGVANFVDRMFILLIPDRRRADPGVQARTRAL